MTGPRITPDPTELPPAVLVDGEVRTAAGSPASLSIMVTNRAPEPRIIAVTALGVDATWLPAPGRSRPIMPGESIGADLTFAPARGTVPARYPIAIAVEALDPASGAATTPTVIADVVLVVDEPSQIAVELDPPAATAVFRRNVTVTLHNSGATPATVSLEARSPTSTRVELSASDVVVGPGQSVPVRGKVRVARPRVFGPRARHTYTVTARSEGAPKHVEGALTVRAVLGPAGTKAIVLLSVVAVWVTLAIVFIPKLSNHVKSGQNVAAGQTKTSTGAASGGAGTSGGSGASGAGSGKSGGAKSGKPGSGAAGAGSGTKTASSIQLNGTVTGNSPNGVAVAISPTSLVSEAAAGATGVGVSTADFRSGPIGKVPESALLLTPPRRVSPNSATSTGADGAWSFPNVKAPGYYLLTFAKPGYQTQRYIVDSSAAIATQPIKVQLVPGQGSLHGTVRGPKGLVGAAQITITDGTNTITASSNSTGSVGNWSIDGLSTPSTYLVSVSKDGMSTESSLVTLDAGGQANVALTLKVGVASLVGTVQDAFKAGLGDVQVTATDGTVTRTATTVTRGPIGSYVLPDLAPGTYSVTFALSGYQTQTRKAVIKPGTSKKSVNATLTSASAAVTGTVSGVLFNDDGTVKNDSSGTAVVGALNGAGLVLTSAANTYKTITTSDGKFGFNGVAPGTYVLSAEYSGLTTGFVTVDATAGHPSPPVTFSLKLAPTINTATITGYVGSAISSGGTLGCADNTTAPPPPGGVVCQVTFTLTDSDRHTVPTRLKDGDPFAVTSRATPAVTGPTPYTLSAEDGVPPGLYHLTVGATGYLPGSISIRVPANRVATAPQLNLYPANTIAGTIGALGELGKDGAGTSYTNCVWAIPDGFSDPTGTITRPPTQCPTADADLPDQTSCTSLGNPTPNLGIIAGDNTYRVGGLCDGNYKMYVVIKNPTYESIVPVASEAVSHGQTLDYSPHVPRKGRIILTFKRYDPTTGTVVSDLDATPLASVSCIPASPASTAPDSTDASGRLVVSGVDASTSVTCVASITAAHSPTGKPLQGAVANLSVGDDNDTAATITLTQGLGAVIGQVLTTFGDGPQPLAGADVNVTGITGYSGTTPDTTGPKVVRTNNQGCFGIVFSDGDSLPTPSWCGTLSAADHTLVTLPLVGALATVDVLATDGTAEKLSQVNLSTDTTSATPANVFQVTPKPSSTANLSLQSLQTGEPAANLARANIQITGDTPVGAGTVTVTATNSGNLIWNDTHIGSGSQAWPGVYHLSATLAGYIAATVTVNCPLPTATGSDCIVIASNDPAPPAGEPHGRFVLVALGSLTGTVVGLDPGTGATQTLPAAIVTATCHLGGEKYPLLKVCPSAPLQTQTDPSGRYTFQDSVATFLMTPGQWTVSVSADGYSAMTVASVTVDPGANEQAAIQLNALGILNGTVSGKDTNGASLGAIPGATISAHCEARAAGAPQCPADDPADLKTDNSGHFSFTDPITRYFMLPGSWTITVTADGYSPTPTPVTITAGTNTKSFSVSALGSLSGKVVGLGSLPLSTANVAYVFCGSHGSTCPTTGEATTNTDGSGLYSLTGSPTTYSLALGDWQVTASALGYISQTTVVNVSSGPNLTNFALIARGTLAGSITGLGDAPLGGATVALHCLTGTPAACPASDPASQRTDSSGHYAFTGNDTQYVLTPGTWRITISAPGYTTSVKSDLTISPGTNSYSTTVTSLGTLSGHVIGYLGPDTSYPAQALIDASVSAVQCTVSDGTTTCPSGSAGAKETTTNSNGDFKIEGTASPYVLEAGTWKVTVSLVGFTTFSQQVEIVPGANSLARNYLIVTPVTVPVGIETAPSTLFTCPSATPACAQVVLTRTDTRQVFTKTTADPTTSRYTFTNMSPATYSVTVTGAGLLQSTNQITVLPGSSTNYDLPVGIVQNTVSGLVTGPALGKAATVGALNGVPVELGHLDTSTTPATFVRDKGTDANDLVTSTTANAAGVAGAFSFTNVKNGSYVARYNFDSPGHPAKNGYESVVSTSFVNVTSGQATSFPTAQLVRVTQKVTLTVTTTDSADIVSSSTGVQLAAPDDAAYTLAPQPVTTTAVSGGGTRFTWVFNAVPSGDWLTSITLPGNHFGTLVAQSGSDGLSCSAGTKTTPVRCTSGSGSPVTVSGGPSETDVTEAYTLDEFLAGLSVVAHPLGNDDQVIPPTTVSFTVKDDASTPNTVFSDSSFPVSASALTPPTATFWGATGSTYTGSATTTAANWSPAGQTYSSTNPARPCPLNETAAAVKITFAGTAFTGNATVTLVPPSGSGIAPPVAKTGAVGDTVSFSGIPFGTDWTVNVTANKHVDAVPGTPGTPGTPASDTPLTGTATFDVTTSAPAPVSVSLHP
jgi:hypothetical protein